MITLFAIGLATWFVYRVMMLTEDVIVNKIPLKQDSYGLKYLLLAGAVFGAFFIFFRTKIRFK